MSCKAAEKSVLVTRHNPWATGSLLLLAFLFWLLNHPYQGIWHDARVYGLIAAHWIYPEALAHDLFFRFGSQGSLSLFTPIYGELVRALGLDLAARLVVLTGGLLWCVALFALARTLLGDTLAGRFAVLFGVMLSVSYSPNASVFVLNENFATARSWVMPCGLLAVALGMQGRTLRAGLLALLSCLLHPLLGIWPLALLLARILPLRYLVPGTLLPTLGVLAIGSVGGLDSAGLRLIDGDLLAYIQNAPDIIFKAGASRVWLHCLPLLVLVLGGRLGSPAWRVWYRQLALLGAGALLMAWVASVVYPVEFVVQAQPWRVTWLTMPMAGMAFLDSLQRLHRASPLPYVVPSLVGIVLALASLGVPAGNEIWLGLGVILLAASFLPMSFWQTIMAWLPRVKFGIFFLLACLWLMALPNVWVELEIAGGRFIGSWWLGALPLHGLVAGGLGWLPLLLAFGLGRLSAGWARVLLLLMFPLLAVTLVDWDWRREAQRSEEAHWLNLQAPPHPFTRFIALGDTIAWPEKEATVWFRLHTANYVGEIQHIGVVFSRDRFAEWQRRDAFLKRTGDRRHNRLALCADPVVDWVVLPEPAVQAAPTAVTEEGALYTCAPYRILSADFLGSSS